MRLSATDSYMDMKSLLFKILATNEIITFFVG